MSAVLLAYFPVADFYPVPIIIVVASFSRSLFFLFRDVLKSTELRRLNGVWCNSPPACREPMVARARQSWVVTQLMNSSRGHAGHSRETTVALWQAHGQAGSALLFISESESTDDYRYTQRTFTNSLLVLSRYGTIMHSGSRSGVLYE